MDKLWVNTTVIESEKTFRERYSCVCSEEKDTKTYVDGKHLLDIIMQNKEAIICINHLCCGDEIFLLLTKCFPAVYCIFDNLEYFVNKYNPIFLKQTIFTSSSSHLISKN